MELTLKKLARWGSRLFACNSIRGHLLSFLNGLVFRLTHFQKLGCQYWKVNPVHREHKIQFPISYS